MTQNNAMRIRGERVLLGRRDLNLDQAEFARRVKVSPSYISSLERNKAGNVTVETLGRLAEVLSLPVTYLLGVSDSPLPPDDEGPFIVNDHKLVYDVPSRAERHEIQQWVELLRDLTPTSRQIIIDLAERLHKLESSGANDREDRE